MSHFELANIVG